MIADTSRSTSLPPNCTYHAFKMGLQRSGLSEWSTNRGGGGRDARRYQSPQVSPSTQDHRSAHTHAHPLSHNLVSSFPSTQYSGSPANQAPPPSHCRISTVSLSSPAHILAHSSSQFATPTWSQARETRRSVIAGRSTVAPFSSSYVMPLEQGARVSDKAQDE